MLRIVKTLGVALALVACGGSNNTDVDAGTTGADGSTPATDAGSTRPDAGARDAGGAADDCLASTDNAAETVGCNGGFISTAPAANGPFGACTPDGMDGPGSCTDTASFCIVLGAGPEGQCVPTCEIGADYVSTGGCPLGSRCFDLGGQGICFRDCDDTHACPAGQMCDGEGSCIGAEPPPDMDAGTPVDVDAGAPVDVDAGTPAVDAG